MSKDSDVVLSHLSEGDSTLSLGVVAPLVAVGYADGCYCLIGRASGVLEAIHDSESRPDIESVWSPRYMTGHTHRFARRALTGYVHA